MALSIFNDGVIEIVSMSKSILISPILYVVTIILGAFLICCSIFMKKKSGEYKFALTAAVAGIMANVLGEFFLGAVTHTIISGIDFGSAMVLSAISLPATLLNGVISIIIAVHIFYIIRNKTNILDVWNKI